VPVALISNIGWDPVPVLRRYAVLDDFDVLVLSDERGVVKPDPKIFRMACAELGVAPAACVMIGDNPDADGGAVALGIEFRLVTADADRRAPDALLRATGLR
jgi:HAD superfamily hydrolase (TIGR01549 family)